MRKVDKFLKITEFTFIVLGIISILYFIIASVFELTNKSLELPFQIIITSTFVVGAIWLFVFAYDNTINDKE